MRELKRPASERGARSRGAQGETARKIKVWFPAWAAAKRPDRFTLLLAALAVLGAVLILARQVTYGVGLSADFVTYLSTARSLLAGEGFIQIHGWPYLHWPPLYPMLLAAASLFAFDPYDVAGPLNAAVFGLTLFVAGQYLRRHVQHPLLVLWACLAIMLAIPLTRVASQAISEAPFILFATLSLVRTSTFLDTGKRSDLIWAPAFASLAFLTRYIGVTLIITALPLLIFQRGVVPLEKAKRIGLYLLIAALPVALWLLRNVLVHGSYEGPRNPSPYTLLEVLDKFLSDLGGWVFLYLPSGNVRVAAAALVGVACWCWQCPSAMRLSVRAGRRGTAPDGALSTCSAALPWCTSSFSPPYKRASNSSPSAIAICLPCISRSYLRQCLRWTSSLGSSRAERP